MDSENTLHDKLLQLECHFTWDLKKEEIKINDLEITIPENIQFSVEKYKGKLYNYLAYVKHLKGFNEEALKYLEQAEEITKKDHEDEFEKLVIVTYGNFAWVHYHMECHFTWDLKKEEIKINDLEITIPENIQFSVEKYKGKLYNYLAYVKHLKGFNEEALKYLEQAEEITKKDHEDEFEKLVIVTYGNFAWVHYHMGELTKAQSYLEKLEDICKTFPTASRYSVLLPIVYAEKGWSFLKVCDEKHYKIAKECFERALEEEPDEKEWNADYAIVLYRLETFGPSVCAEDSVALKQLKHALELDPENPVLMVHLGIKLQLYEQNEEALKLVNQALKLSPQSPSVAGHAASFFRNHGCPDKSLEVLKEALQAAPDSHPLHYQLGLTYRSKIGKFQGQWNQDPTEFEQFVKLSIVHLEKAVRMKPSKIQPQLDLAQMYAESNNMPQAEHIYQRLFDTPFTWLDDIQRLHLCFGNFQYYYKKSEPDAIKHYKIGLQMQNTSIASNKCYARLQKIARKRIAMNQHAEGFAILASAHELRNELPQAIDYYEKALQHDPDNERYMGAIFDLCDSLQYKGTV
ncbi:interferon-induced protein with tetratricopeptide repeats 1-like [Polyodon spathula]|uniref:interferon-induced protein with tetratricopeptide repeats 1-like n=1 Tax=Polyodon spathula TaxID=7913 RepID=UPI001B7F57AD|nr:interferon-induced protein with tetratricopeptide repeats 1-like [Polyodon spathula]